MTDRERPSLSGLLLWACGIIAAAQLLAALLSGDEVPLLHAAYYVGAAALVFAFVFALAGQLADVSEVALETAWLRRRHADATAQSLPHALRRNVWLAVFAVVFLTLVWAAWSIGLVHEYETVSAMTRQLITWAGLGLLVLSRLLHHRLRR